MEYHVENEIASFLKYFVPPKEKKLIKREDDEEDRIGQLSKLNIIVVRCQLSFDYWGVYEMSKYVCEQKVIFIMWECVNLMITLRMVKQ